MLVELSFDDGSVHDLKAVEFLEKYGLKATFYVPGINELGERNLQNIADLGHVIGGHTMTHPLDLKMLSKEKIEQEISDGNDYVAAFNGKYPETFAYPRGRYDLRVIEVLKKLGVREARTTIVGKIEVEDRYRKHTTAHIGFQRKEYGGEDWLAYARKMLMKAKLANGYFHAWGHSAEIEANGQWRKVEALFQDLKDAM